MTLGEGLGPRADAVAKVCGKCVFTRECGYGTRAAGAIGRTDLSTEERDQRLADGARSVPKNCPERTAVMVVLETPVA
jgi:hypothetical protein